MEGSSPKINERKTNKKVNAPESSYEKIKENIEKEIQKQNTLSSEKNEKHK